MYPDDITITSKDQIEPKYKTNGGRFEQYKYEITRRHPGAGLYACIYEIPPEKTICPYHYHARSEELFYIISGAGILRTPDGERAIAPGDIVICPNGEAGAHSITNSSDTQPLVYLDVDTVHHPDVCFYPDSGKLGVEGKVFRADSEVGYYDGE
jgi:uncharacterized cupin superfamily protein